LLDKKSFLIKIVSRETLLKDLEIIVTVHGLIC